MVSKMAPQFSRADTLELKENIVQACGRHKAAMYFSCLSRLLSLKFKRSDFVKLVGAIVGKENLHLHNQLIKSMYSNALSSNKPPSKQTTTKESENAKPVRGHFGNQPTVIPNSGRSKKTCYQPSPIGKIPNENTQDLINSSTIKTAPEIIHNGRTSSCPILLLSDEDDVDQSKKSPGIQSGSHALLELEHGHILTESQFNFSQNGEIPVSCDDDIAMYLNPEVLVESTNHNSTRLEDTEFVKNPLGLGFDKLPCKEQYKVSPQNGTVICEGNDEVPGSCDNGTLMCMENTIPGVLVESTSHNSTRLEEAEFTKKPLTTFPCKRQYEDNELFDTSDLAEYLEAECKKRRLTAPENIDLLRFEIPDIPQYSNEVPFSCDYDTSMCLENNAPNQNPTIFEESELMEKPIAPPLGLGFDNFPCREQCNFSSQNGTVICQENDELPDTRNLAKYLGAKFKKQGLAAPVNSIDLLNSSLDVYLKRLIEPCMSLTKPRANRAASLLDFEVAAESNRKLLGGGSPVVSQRINACFFR